MPDSGVSGEGSTPSALVFPKRVERVAGMASRLLTNDQYAALEQMSPKFAHDIFPSAFMQVFGLFCKGMEHRDELDDGERARKRVEDTLKAEVDQATKALRAKQREVDDLILKLSKSEGQVKIQQGIIDNQRRDLESKNDQILDLQSDCELADVLQKEAEKARDDALAKIENMYAKSQVEEMIDDAVDEAVTSQVKVCWYNCGADFNYAMWTGAAKDLVLEWESDPAMLEEKRAYLEAEKAEQAELVGVASEVGVADGVETAEETRDEATKGDENAE